MPTTDQTRLDVVEATMSPREVVIVALSKLEGHHGNDCGRAENQARNAKLGSIVDYSNGHTNRFPWQQAMRAIARHIVDDRPPEVVVATSTESWVDLPDFLKIADGFLAPYRVDNAAEPWRGKLSDWGAPVDFEDFEAVTGKLRALIAQKKREGRRSICVDITGGQKTFSAAATLVTVNDDIVISYVRTENTLDVRMYNIVFQGPDANVVASGGVLPA